MAPNWLHHKFSNRDLKAARQASLSTASRPKPKISAWNKQNYNSRGNLLQNLAKS
jgi:hypothetical protein